MTPSLPECSGGGIGGLAFAVSLAKLDAAVDVDIYESTSKFGEIGAGMGMWPRVWETLKNMGLEDDLRERFNNGGGGQSKTLRRMPLMHVHAYTAMARWKLDLLQGRPTRPRSLRPQRRYCSLITPACNLLEPLPDS